MSVTDLPTGWQARLSDLYGHARWRRARAGYLRLNPRCMATTHEADCRRVAEVIDHIVPRSTATSRAHLQALTWERSNWQGLSKACHDAKTRIEQAADRAAWAAVKDGRIREPAPPAIPSRSAVLTGYDVVPDARV